MRSIPVQDVSQVGEARRVAAMLVAGVGFGEVAAGRVGIVVTELATNMLRHGGGGELVLGIVEEGGRIGLRCLALDKGIGIADFERALRDGYSTAGGPGEGLGAIRRQSAYMEVYSSEGNGTAVLATLCETLDAPVDDAPVEVGAVCLPIKGEVACGDAWALRRTSDAVLLLVVDGLGHGPQAAEAAASALTAFEGGIEAPPSVLLTRLHGAMRSTRGGAASIVHLPEGSGDVLFAGVGNVAGAVVSAAGTRRMVSHNGTLGHVVKRVQDFSYPLPHDGLVVLASDGLGTTWTLDSYPGLRACHPALIAGVIYRDFSRGRDDVTVLVVRRQAA